MKQIIFLLFVIIFQISFSQSLEYVGGYKLTLEGSNKSYIETNLLTLNADGSFKFNWSRYIKSDVKKEEQKLVTGKWTSNKRLILLSVDELDNASINLNATKLRLDTISPRDKSNRDIKTSVRIIVSKVSWLKGRTLVKL